MLSDQQLIDAVRAGDSSQFTELMQRYQNRLIGLLWHVCSNRELAEDLSQETFFRAYRKLHLYEGQSLFYTWLSRIALNLLASFRRRSSMETRLTRQGFEMAVDSVGTELQPDQRLEVDETQRCVQQAIAMLDEDRRAVILLRDFEDMDYEAIASVLDIPVGTVRSRLHRARLELRQLIQSMAPQLDTTQSG